jgi:cellulose synthase/poly-beta-1,6-N-acetylglucosamine synthase-like glycosyltransferase
MISLIFVGVLAIFSLLPVAVMVLTWSWYAWRSANPHPPLSKLPNIAVILSLRGADPSLERCLEGILLQDYPAYSVHIVVDSADDPAREVVASVLARGHAPHVDVHVEVRQERSERCSLKLSAQRQILTQLNDAVEVVAFLDADSVPSANWLRAMVAPFSNPRVAAASGIRWSTPPDHGWGTLVRHVFNALTFPQMFLYRMPWGGSLALRKNALEQAGLLDYWSRCFCEDASSYGPIRSLGLRLAFVPLATQVNSESIELAGAHQFMLRQIVCARLHHVFWPRVFAQNVATILSILICCLLATLGLIGVLLSWFGVTTELGRLIGLAILPLLQSVGVVTMVWASDRLVRRVVPAPKVAVGLPRLVGAVLLGMYEVSTAMIEAPLQRSINWRGITYDIEGRGRIRMRAFHPYHSARGQPTSTHSIL